MVILRVSKIAGALEQDVGWIFVMLYVVLCQFLP